MSSVSGGSRPGASTFLPRIARTVLILAGLTPACACGRAPQLQHTADSPTAVAQAVIAALDRKDVAALDRLAVSEDEFRHLVWPRLPAARPERNIPWDFAWNDLAGKSRLQLRGRLNEWPASQGMTVMEVAFDGETTDYEDYRVLRKSRVTLRDARGTLQTVRVFGSLIEQRGRYKVFSYVVD